MDEAIKALLLAVIACMSIMTTTIKAEVKSRIEALQSSRAYEQIDESDVTVLAKLVWGEARGVGKTEQAAVVWCVLNRVDAGYADGTIYGVATARGQFTGYRSSNPVTDAQREIAADVLYRWYLEKLGVEDVGRVLPKEYLYFRGNGLGNVFRTTYKNGTVWDWSLPSPYED